MYETILQETTGVKLYQEEDKFVNATQWEQLCNKWDDFALTLQNDRHMSNTDICEIYFDSPMAEKQPEKFLITIEKKGNNKTFTLKRRAQIGNYGSEKTARLSKKQYMSIIKGKIDWMKESGKLLLNEFYHKIQLFEYKIATVVTCVRQEMYLQKEQLLITVDSSIQRLFGDQSAMGIQNNQEKLAYVRVRCTKDNQPTHPHLIEEWLQ